MQQLTQLYHLGEGAGADGAPSKHVAMRCYVGYVNLNKVHLFWKEVLGYFDEASTTA